MVFRNGFIPPHCRVVFKHHAIAKVAGKVYANASPLAAFGAVPLSTQVGAGDSEFSWNQAFAKIVRTFGIRDVFLSWASDRPCSLVWTFHRADAGFAFARRRAHRLREAAIPDSYRILCACLDHLLRWHDGRWLHNLLV